MNKQRKGAALASVVGLAFVVLEIAFHVQTAIAGVFIVGMAGGLLVGVQMAARPSAPV
jgi:uncharacterized membrane protein YciS (DUF1049 family)